VKENRGVADRHLLPVGSLHDTIRADQQFVRIIVCERWALSKAGQLLTSCLVNLLVRQVKLVSHIEIVSPRTQLLVRMPNGEVATEFPECLETLGVWAVNGDVVVSTWQTESLADHTIFVGEFVLESVPPQSLFIIGDGWRAWAGDSRNRPRSVSPTSSNPLGPFLAAALAAGEVFKRTRGILRGNFLLGNGYSLWSGAGSPSWETLEDGPDVAGLALPPVHLVGAGAVGNAVAYAVANFGLNKSYMVVIDDDKYDYTNLNRCLLAGWRDFNHQKVDAVSNVLNFGGLVTYPFAGTIKSYVGNARSGLRADVAQQVKNLTFKVVVSCVDKGLSRQDVQGLHPELLIGGSTLDLQAKSNLYTREQGLACLACFNPAERDGEKMRALEERLRTMQTDERTHFLRENGLDVAIVEEYLAGSRCGGLGEAALSDFVTRAPSEFSVGFVSLGSGLLVAAALLRNALFSGIASRRAGMTTLNFLNGGFIDSRLAADDACEQRCQDRFRAT